MSAAQKHFHNVVNISVGITVTTMLVATVVINQLKPPHAGDVLSQATSQNAGAIRTATYALTIHSLSRGVTNTTTSQQRVTLKLTLENLSPSILGVSPGLQMFLRTHDGRQYNMTAKYLAPGLVIGGPLSPHAATDLSLDFDLTAGAPATEFIYQPDAGSQPSIIKL